MAEPTSSNSNRYSAAQPLQGNETQKLRPVGEALRNGATMRCPACGKGALFYKYLKVNDHCPECGEALHYQRADDAPPYFTIILVGHIVVALMVLVEELDMNWPIWLQEIIWPILALSLCLLLLPIIKGMLISYQWALRMHGFGGKEELVSKL